MKLRLQTPVIAAIAALLFLVSCSKTNKQGRMIPKDAGFVLHVNSRSLSEKVNMAEIKQTDWYKHIMAEMDKDTTAPEFMKKLHDNIGKTGVDSTADIIFFGQYDSSQRMNLVLEGGLKDAKAFETFLKGIYPAGAVNKDGDIQSMSVMGHAVVTWNNEKFVMGSNSISMPQRAFASINNTEIPNLEGITAFCKSLYSLKEDKSMAKDEKFTELMNTDGDLHAFVSVENLMGSSSLPMGMLNMIKLDDFTKGNVSTYTASFDNGKISLKTKSYVGKELGAIFKKYSGGSINTDMIKSIPSDNIIGLLSFHYKPEGLKEMVKLSGMDGIADMLLFRQGFTVDDFIRATKGDIMIAVSDLTLKPDTSLAMFGIKNRTEPDAKVLFSVAINDKEAFNKLLRAGKNMGGSDAKVHYSSNANYFAIGNDENMITQYLAGGKHEQPFLSKISGSAIGAYIDIQKILKAMQPDAAKDSIGKLMWDESVKVWDNATLTGGDYSNGGLSQLFEVNLMDKNTNSLKQLFQYSLNMSALVKEKKKNQEAEFDHMPPMAQDSLIRFTPPKIVKDVPLPKKKKN